MHHPRLRHYKSTVIEDYGIISEDYGIISEDYCIISVINIINIQRSTSKTNMYTKRQCIGIQMTNE